MKPSGKFLIAVDDMFFAAKILAVAAQVGREVERVRTAAELEAALAASPPQLLILDLNSSRWDAIAVIKALKSSATQRAVPVLGFLSHVEVERRRQALSAGCDYVLARSAFAAQLADILAGKLPRDRE